MAQTGNQLAGKLAQQSGVMTPAVWKSSLTDWLEQKSKTLLVNLGHNQKAKERIVSGVMNALERNPVLFECTQASIRNCIIMSSVTGLAPGSFQEAAYLPFKNNKTGKREATFCPMYHGIVRLLYESGYVKRIDCKVVYENDSFEYQEGIDVKLLFIRFAGLEESRGKPIGAYSLIINKWGEPLIKYMSAEEIEAVKNKAPGARTSDSPWNSKDQVAWESMWMKTVLKQNTKFIPKSKELLEAIQADDEAEGQIPKREHVPFMTEVDDEAGSIDVTQMGDEGATDSGDPPS